MTEQRTEFQRVVRHGWFAWLYWGVTSGGICAVIAIWIWEPNLLAISGYVVIAVVIALMVGRYVLAAKLKREENSAARSSS